ncbi:MAG TPA: EB domain-containing protein [Myxococcota bacterium]|jgi:hypothetical protein
MRALAWLGLVVVAAAAGCDGCARAAGEACSVDANCPSGTGCANGACVRIAPGDDAGSVVDAGPVDAGTAVPRDAGVSPSNDAGSVVGSVDAGALVVTACPAGASTSVVSLDPDAHGSFTALCLLHPSEIDSALDTLDDATGGWLLVLTVSESDSAAGHFDFSDAAWNSNERIGDPTTTNRTATARGEGFGRAPLHEVLMVLDYGNNDVRGVRMPLGPVSSLLAALAGTPNVPAGLPVATWSALSDVDTHIFGTAATTLNDGVNAGGVRIGASVVQAGGAQRFEEVGLGLGGCGDDGIGAGAYTGNGGFAGCAVARVPAAALVFVR